MRALQFGLGIAALVSSAAAADYFPLQAGNRWTYRNARTGGSFTVEVGPAVVINERVYYGLRGYAAGDLLVRFNEQKDLVQVDQETGNEVTLTSFLPKQGGWWEAPSRGCRHEGMTLERGTAHDGKAGPIPDVLEVFYRVIGCADTGIGSEQYAANIGMVRRATNSIAGPVTFDLESASVGNIRIDAAQHASFTAGVLQTEQQGIQVLLRLETNSPLDLKLRYPTGQEFDVAVRDDAGRVVWKWSDGQFFTAAQHETTITGKWSRAVPIPSELLASLRRQARIYAIQGWLTTAGPTPSFAATVPLPLTTNATPAN